MIFTIPSMLWLELTALHAELKSILTQVLVIGNLCLVGLGMDFFIYERNCCQFVLADLSAWGLCLGQKLHPGGRFFNRFFGRWPVLILKSFEGSKFILSPIEVGHWVAQMQPFFGKLPEITDFQYQFTAHIGTFYTTFLISGLTNVIIAYSAQIPKMFSAIISREFTMV